MRGFIHEVTEGAEQLRVGQQYAKNPSGGVVVGVHQRTTHAGRSILLTPMQVRQLRDDLTAWLESLPSGVIP